MEILKVQVNYLKLISLTKLIPWIKLAFDCKKHTLCISSVMITFKRLIILLIKIENLFLIGSNVMLKYNNAGHSILTPMVAIEKIISTAASKDKYWLVNAEEEYHDEN